VSAVDYERKIVTWCVAGPSGASGHKDPGPCWKVVGFGMASVGGSAYATIVYERECTPRHLAEAEPVELIACADHGGSPS
jgi:hypothetical protein